jgi:hypothetical protein
MLAVFYFGFSVKKDFISSIYTQFIFRICFYLNKQPTLQLPLPPHCDFDAYRPQRAVFYCHLPSPSLFVKKDFISSIYTQFISGICFYLNKPLFISALTLQLPLPPHCDFDAYRPQRAVFYCRYPSPTRFVKKSFISSIYTQFIFRICFYYSKQFSLSH